MRIIYSFSGSVCDLRDWAETYGWENVNEGKLYESENIKSYSTIFDR